MASSANLDGLPVELIERIAQYAGNDTKNLRLVSQYVSAAVLKTYKLKFFTDLKVLLALESSLRKAIHVMNSPNLGPSVRRLIVDDDAFPGFNRLPADDERRKAQVELRDDKADLCLLTELLQKCGQKGTVSTIHFRAFIEYVGTPSHERPLTLREREGKDHGFMTLMHALALSGTFFKRFAMGIVPHAQFSLADYTFTAIPVMINRSALNDMKSLFYSISMRRSQILDLIFEAGDEYTPRSDSFLAAVPFDKIRSLEIKPFVDGKYIVPSCSLSAIKLLMKLKFPFLKALTIRWARFDWGDLVTFLRRQKKLGRLVMYGIKLKECPKHLRWPTSPGLTWRGDRLGDGGGENFVQALSRSANVDEVVDQGQNWWR